MTSETNELIPKTEKRDRFAFFRALKPKILSRINRKYVVIACSVILLGGAIYLNWLFFSDNTEPAATPQGQDGDKVIDYTAQGDGEDSYFAVAQLNRQRARDEAIEVYQTVATNEEAVQELRDDALSGINRIASRIEKEANIETLIRSKGFAECVAVLGDGTASIIVSSDTEELLPNQIAQIKEIVVEQSSLPVSAIKIVGFKQ